MKGLRLFVCLFAAVAIAAAVLGCTKTDAPKDAGDTKIKLSIIIDGSKGEDKAINDKGEIELSSGSTAYDALKEFCDSKGYEITGDPSYVKTIGGLGEGSFGAAPCGWMFSVDGDYPTKAANDYEMQNGNELKWEFVK